MFLSHDIAEAFTAKRNPVLSFPFLKENGELLCIAANSGFLMEPRAVELYKDFYQGAYKFTKCYPQYYRFTLGMVQNLERGGMAGEESQRISDYVRQENYVMFDTSNCRKLETLTLLGDAENLTAEYSFIYDDILRNMEQITENPNWYTKFNKPLFYDLTHIIFYLTDYGSKPLPLKTDVYPCLINIGLLAILDDDADLLAEICICLGFIGQEIPEVWDEYLTRSIDDIEVSYEGTISSTLNPAVDEYHVYFVVNWYRALRGMASFECKFKSRCPSFSIPNAGESLLSKLSTHMHHQRFNTHRAGAGQKQFLDGLPVDELLQWNAIMSSHSQSDMLITKFCAA